MIRLMSEKSRILVEKFEKDFDKSEFGKFLVRKIFGLEMKPPLSNNCIIKN